MNVFRCDRKLKTLYIQAGVNDELAIVVFVDGEWGVCLMPNLDEMTTLELKQYLSKHRNNDEAFSEALGELLNAILTPNRIQRICLRGNRASYASILRRKIAEELAQPTYMLAYLLCSVTSRARARILLCSVELVRAIAY